MGIITSQPEDTSGHDDNGICADLWPARHVINQIRLREVVALIWPNSGQIPQGKGRWLLDREPVVRAIFVSYHPDVKGS